MRRTLVLLAAGCAALAVGAGSARATNECHGFMACVPVAGPWVVVHAGIAGVQFQLACPKRYTVGGLDAELSSRSIDLEFLGKLGSPVNPGITTSDTAVFVGRLLGGTAPAASFRPHIGCIPGQGGGQRVPTAYRAYPPSQPATLRVTELPVVAAASNRGVARCQAHERLAGATYAVGFFTDTPPSAAVIGSVHVTQTVQGARVLTTVRAGAAARGMQATVQVELECVAA